MNRSRFQGVATVLRFNWHFFLIAGFVILGMLILSQFAQAPVSMLLIILAFGVFATSTISLLATYLAYDHSKLYDLGWLAPYAKQSELGANVHSGFDETTTLLRTIYPGLQWQAFDFYNPEKHTEISIRRARASQKPIPGTIEIDTEKLEIESSSFDLIVLTLAAHEIRDHSERVQFFLELKRALNSKGRIIVTEHLRDFPNLLAYSIGAFHFHSKMTWLETFEHAGLRLETEINPAPLIHSFVLRK